MPRLPKTTYFITMDKDGRLIAHAPNDKGIGGLPLQLAMNTTVETFAEFGRSEGLRRTLYEIDRYLQHADLEAQKGRIVFNSKPVTLPDGRTFPACASCGHSAAAEIAFWEEFKNSLRHELANPPKGRVQSMPAEDAPAPESEE